MTAATTAPRPAHRPGLRHRPGSPVAGVAGPPVRARRPRRGSRATYRRRRVVAAALVLGAVLVAGRAGAALGGPSLAGPERPPSVTSYVVAPGDTLWSIARHLEPGADPRPVVDAIIEVRGPGPLQPGETILWVG